MNACNCKILIYGLADSGDQLQETSDDHLKNELSMIPTIIDQSLYLKFENDQLIGSNGSYVDDPLRDGNNG